MTAMILGLVLFLGLHSTRIVADDLRSRFIAQRGLKPWRGLYSVGSALGLVLVVWGYSLTLQAPVVLRTPAAWVRPAAAAINLPAMVLIAAAYVPRNHFKAWLGHPMVLGTALWALAHLLATRTLADLLLFGAFFVWALLCYRSLRARDRAAGTKPVAALTMYSTGAVALGVGLWFLLGFWLHPVLVGIRPLP